MARQRSVEKEEFWRLVLAEYDRSGLSVAAFCRRESISPPSFYAWRKKLRAQVQSKFDTTLVPLELVAQEAEPAERPSPRPSVTIRLGGGVSIDVFAGQDS